jgi:hypothetical protein
MATRKRKPVAKGKLHLQPKNQGRAAAARMQSKGKLWKKVRKVRTKGAGVEKEIFFQKVIDKLRRKRGGTKSKAAWMGEVRSAVKASSHRKKKAS